MLTIKKPIALISRQFTPAVAESFYHKIRGNYAILTCDIEEEDLLHLVTAPAQVYLGEEGSSNIFMNHSVYENREIKMEVLNNLLNRISLKEEINLTYQDKVYIEAILRKMGIRNTTQFFAQIVKQKEKNEFTEIGIRNAWNTFLNEQHKSEYRETVSKQDIRETRSQQEEYRNYLYESVINRLKTGVIYQIMDNFSSFHMHSSETISNEQLLLSEQKKTARQILYNQMENYFREEALPFVYLEKNAYEYLDYTQDLTSPTRIDQQIVQAVLYQLINSIHYQRLTSHRADEHHWVDVKGALYQTAENTLHRMQNVLTQAETNLVWNEEYPMRKAVLESRMPEALWSQTREEYVHALKEQLLTQLPPQEQQEEGEEREILRSQLEEINRQNIRRWEEYQRLLQLQEVKPQITKKTVQEIKEESLQALSEPQQLLMQYRQEADRQQEEAVRSRERMFEMLPEETKRIYRILEEYGGRAETTGDMGISKDNLGLFLQDTQWIEREQQLKELALIQRESERTQLSRETLHRWTGERAEAPALSRENREYAVQLELIHKS
ncbi:MAG: hypothetical protein IJC59_05470, partial [Lachnospiraceae bacterium]|nr:hypothetical protein [Lachnospiraceae bacterium]